MTLQTCFVSGPGGGGRFPECEGWAGERLRPPRGQCDGANPSHHHTELRCLVRLQQVRGQNKKKKTQQQNRGLVFHTCGLCFPPAYTRLNAEPSQSSSTGRTNPKHPKCTYVTRDLDMLIHRFTSNVLNPSASLPLLPVTWPTGTSWLIPTGWTLRSTWPPPPAAGTWLETCAPSWGQPE